MRQFWLALRPPLANLAGVKLNYPASFRRLANALFAAAFFLGSLLPLRATTVEPPSFSELVADSQLVVRATVTAISSEWAESPQGRFIRTLVTISVEKHLKGTSDPTVVLRLVGGTVGQETMVVAGMPTFQVGESGVLFIAGNGTNFCPIVRMTHGRYRLQTESATRRRYVVRDDGLTVEQVEDVGLSLTAGTMLRRSRDPARALSLENFEAQIVEEASRHEK